MTEEIYVLWRFQKDELGAHNKVTKNTERKDYPESNIHYHGQYNSLEKVRDVEDAATDCKKCGAQIDAETKIYHAIPPVCGHCMQKHETAKAL